MSLHEKNRNAVKDFLKFHKNKLKIKENFKREPADYILTMEMLSQLENFKSYLEGNI